jgi:hypothetical protein
MVRKSLAGDRRLLAIGRRSIFAGTSRMNAIAAINGRLPERPMPSIRKLRDTQDGARGRL